MHRYGVIITHNCPERIAHAKRARDTREIIAFCRVFFYYEPAFCTRFFSLEHGELDIASFTRHIEIYIRWARTHSLAHQTPINAIYLVPQIGGLTYDDDQHRWLLAHDDTLRIANPHI